MPSAFPAWSISAAAGLAIAAAAYLVARSVSAVPSEDRRYRDRPPLLLVWLWWPIRCVAHYLERYLPAAQHEYLARQLRLAGLDYVLRPAQWLAAGMILAALAAGLLWSADSLIGSVLPGWLMAAMAAGASGLPWLWIADRRRQRIEQARIALPFYLDLLTLCVEAGLNLTSALQLAVAKGPPGVLREEFSRVLRDVRAGRPRAEALRNLGDRVGDPGAAMLATALIQAEQSGMELGPVLRAQADQQRMERFARAEAIAMQAPVKLLFPLLFCIFPCVFLVIGFPIALRFLQMGL
jgi:tight adherence protein C